MFRTTPDPDVEFLAVEVLPALVGAKISGIATNQPNGEMGTAGIGLIVLLTSGEHKVVWIDRDEEGNGPGWVAIEDISDAEFQLRSIAEY